MNWAAAGAIGEIVGAGAVVLTLIYLAKQIKDSSTQVKVNSLTALNTIYNDAFLPIYNSRENMNIWVTSLSSPEDLPDVDREIFFLFMMRLIAPFETVAAQYRKGTLEEYDFQRYRKTIKAIAQTPGGRAWVATGQMELSTESMKFLELGDAAQQGAAS